MNDVKWKKDHKTFVQYFLKRIHKDIVELKTQLSYSYDKTVLYLHVVIDKFGKEFKENYKGGMVIKDDQSRSDFEEFFTKKCVPDPDYCEKPFERIKELGQASANLKEVQAEIEESMDLTTDQGRKFRMANCPNLFLTPQNVTLDVFYRFVMNIEDAEEKFPVLYLLASGDIDETIFLVKHLPDIATWLKLLNQRFVWKIKVYLFKVFVFRYSRRLRLDEVAAQDFSDEIDEKEEKEASKKANPKNKNKTVQDVFDDVEKFQWGDIQIWKKCWRSFADAWNVLYTLQQHVDEEKRPKLHADCLVKKRMPDRMGFDPKKNLLVFSLPNEKDGYGVFVKAIPRFLAERHNYVLARVLGISIEEEIKEIKQDDEIEEKASLEKAKSATKDTTGKSSQYLSFDGVRRENLVDLDEDDLLQIVSKYCSRKLTYGATLSQNRE